MAECWIRGLKFCIVFWSACRTMGNLTAGEECQIAAKVSLFYPIKSLFHLFQVISHLH
jgi:hypothetical protein